MRLITEQGIPQLVTQGGEILHLDGGAINIKPDSDSVSIGVQLATAIHGGLG
jgi:hypothetical protein